MSDAPILLYDGVCHLCDGTVQFVLRREADACMRFCHLQSDAARALLDPFGVQIEMDTVYLIESGQLYQRSEAILRVLRYLHAPWRWLAVLRLVPRPLRDACYGFIGSRRYRWFGKANSCMLPLNLPQNRFVDDR